MDGTGDGLPGVQSNMLTSTTHSLSIKRQNAVAIRRRDIVDCLCCGYTGALKQWMLCGSGRHTML
jgi:hypothetical protein